MLSKKKGKRLAILASGGPAPGINSVINAATIEAINLGWEVIGIRDGFGGLRDDRVRRLTLDDVAFIHYEGGCILGMSRVNPRKEKETMEKIVATIKRHEIDMLLTIGGDDTAFGCREIAAEVGEGLRTVHVPKTIDNDLPLPEGVPTFGYTTARQVGVELVKNLVRDARTCSRWYIAVSMGRQAGHLALGIGKAAGANLTLIPEDFPDRLVSLDEIADLLEGAVIKSLVRNRPWGVAVLAEGLIERMDPKEIGERLPDLKRDSFGHVRLGDVQLGEWLARELTERLKRCQIDMRFNEVKIGYELRCADPVPFDIEYTRDLGFAAVRFLAEGGTDAMVMIVDGKREMMAFEQLRDPETGRTIVRGVNTSSESYLVARRYMQRLTRLDFDDPQDVERLADAANCTADEFRAYFEHLVADEPPGFGWEDIVRDSIDF
jgi:6-phosphofructokinase 1